MRRSRGVPRGQSILWLKGNPRNFPASFHDFFVLCWDPVPAWTLCFLAGAMKERGMPGLLTPETRRKAAVAYVGKLVIFSYDSAAALYGLYVLSCISQNLTFSRRALCMLFKMGFYEFRYVECLFS